MECVSERLVAATSAAGLTFKYKGEKVTLPWLGSTFAVDTKDGVTVTGAHPSIAGTTLMLRLCKGDAPAATFMDAFAHTSLLWFQANRPDAAATAGNDHTCPH
jgi:hypothetical protein